MSPLKRVLVGDVLQLKRRPVEVVFEAEYAEIGVRSFGRGIFHKEPVTGASLGSKRVFRIEPNDLVISNVFAWEGAVALASSAEEGMIGSHRFMTFVPIDDRLDIGWAAWFFRSAPGLELIRRASPGSAGRNRTLAIERYQSLEIPLPPTAQQRQTVAYLERADAASRAASSRLLECPPFRIVSSLPTFVDSLLGHASKRVRIGDLVDLVSDTVHPGEDASPATSFVGLQHVQSHTGWRIGSDPLEVLKGRKFRFRPGDLIYGYLRPYLNKVWVADRHGLCSVDQYVLRPRPGVSSELLAHALRGREILDAAIDLTHSLQLPRLRSGLLSALQVPVVSDPLAASDLLGRLNGVRDLVMAVADRRRSQLRTADAIVPAALNTAFGAN